MGNGADIPQSVQAALVERLRRLLTTLIFLAFRGHEPESDAVLSRVEKL